MRRSTHGGHNRGDHSSSGIYLIEHEAILSACLVRVPRSPRRRAREHIPVCSAVRLYGRDSRFVRPLGLSRSLVLVGRIKRCFSGFTELHKRSRTCRRLRLSSKRRRSPVFATTGIRHRSAIEDRSLAMPNHSGVPERVIIVAIGPIPVGSGSEARSTVL